MLKAYGVIQQNLVRQAIIIPMGDDQLIFASIHNTILHASSIMRWVDVIVDTYNDNNPDESPLPRITVHGFRRTFATLSHSAEIDPKEVQAQLGHKNLATTLDIYTTVEDNVKAKMPAKFVAYMNS